ncbi:MAG: 2-oxo-4-hydroxy-4-carboxy-5-ureidoimidazoline decarboxylase [Chthoniobacterales bacterium]|nr:2-oxo-4-hydroxy-4-carboxy-5-ureidoimidazoline decarboxylase [Chthoniobacterales bacterium]
MLKLTELNALDREGFTRVAGPVFEHSPWVAERSWDRRPFASREELHAAMCSTVQNASVDEQLALISAHPDLVGRAVLTSESQSEQASAGLGSLSADEVAFFDRYNRDYRERFGFPFVICARLNKKEAILNAFPVRLANSRQKEIETALTEIYKIADLRLHDLIR